MSRPDYRHHPEYLQRELEELDAAQRRTALHRGLRVAGYLALVATVAVVLHHV